jgi:tRNA A37 threonylcarbamoyladenosine synthetase subunit TsaC/SUA5/YrdC
MNGFDLFLDGGRISGGVPSTIVEVTDNKIRIQREGSLTKAEIMKVL